MSAGNQVIYLEVGGHRRRYVLHTPVHLPPGPRPLVVMLDGRGGTPWTAMKTTGWSEVADEQGFVVAYPEAERLDPEGPQHFLDNPQMWNAGSGGSDVERPFVDDTGFLEAVLADVPRHAPVDPSLVFMTGFSNGAAMTFRFASTHLDKIRAIAAVAGYCRVDAVPLPRPIRSLYLFGALDPLSPLHGGMVQLPWGSTEWRPPVLDSAKRWAFVNGLDADRPRTKEADGITWHTFRDAAGRDMFDVGIVSDLGHVWPGGKRLLPESLVGQTSDRLQATPFIWSFFQRAAGLAP